MRALTHAFIDRAFAYGDNNPRRMAPLYENFALRPGINANHAAPAADTYNTAQMQLGLDKNPHFEVLGTNATSALVTHGTDGGLLLTTAGASADQIILLPHLDTGVTKWTGTQWSTDKEIAWRTHVKTGSAVTAQTLWAGFKKTNTPVVATDTDQIFFRYEPSTNEGRLQAVYSASDADYTLDTGIVIQAATRYQLGVFVGPDRIPYFYVGVENDPAKLVAQGIVAMTAAVTALIPYIGVQADAAAAKTLTVYYEEASRNI